MTKPKTVKRIDALTPEQVALQTAHADAWIAVGLSTERADWETFDRAARACYEFAGLAPPKAIVRCASPLLAMLTAGKADNALKALASDSVSGAVYDSVDDAVHGAVDDAVSGAVEGAVSGAVHDSVDDAVSGAVEGAVSNSVSGAVHDSVHGAVYGAVRDSVSGAVYDSVHGAVYGAVRDSVDGAVFGAVHGAVSNSVSEAKAKWMPYFGGNLWSSWLAWESYFHEVCGLQTGKNAEALAFREAQSSVGWWIPCAWGVVVSDRPTVIHIEQVGERGWGSHQMHCAEGPAIAWSDGYALWMWHGVRVTQQIIEAPETLTLEQISSEENAEVRRIMRERFGESEYLIATGAVLADADFEGATEGAAPRALIEDAEGTTWLVGTDGSTGRTYHMPLAHEGGGTPIKTCREAHESLCGFPETLIVTKS
jgi:hypothetical protein